jgi:hypothetical protein
MELHKREWRSLSRPSPYQAFLYPTLSPLHWTDLTCTCFKTKDSTFTFCFSFFVYFLAGYHCVGHSFAYVTLFIFFRDVWIRTQRAAGASRRSISSLAIHFCLSFSETQKDHNFSFPADRSFFFETWKDP